jgi:hypothetical protein
VVACRCAQPPKLTENGHRQSSKLELKRERINIIVEAVRSSEAVTQLLSAVAVLVLCMPDSIKVTALGQEENMWYVIHDRGTMLTRILTIALAKVLCLVSSRHEDPSRHSDYLSIFEDCSKVQGTVHMADDDQQSYRTPI